MRKIFPYIFVAICIITLIAGCKSTPADSKIGISPAPIHEVDIRIAESFPPQVFVYIKGGLSDGCTTFKEIKTNRNGQTFNIDVLVQRPENQMCTQIYGYFEENVSLGTDFESGKTYWVLVNSDKHMFVMP